MWAGQAALALLRGARSAAVRRAASPRLARKAGERRSHADKVRSEQRTSFGAPLRDGGWEGSWDGDEWPVVGMRLRATALRSVWECSVAGKLLSARADTEDGVVVGTSAASESG